MKKILMALAAVFAMSTAVMAGGDITPVEEPVVAAQVKNDSGFYVGGGYGYGLIDKGDFAHTDELFLVAGYDFNQFVAVEGRANFGVGSDLDDFDGFNTLSIFVKPQYPVTDAIKVYGLFGYTYVDFDGYGNTDGLTYGAGASYAVLENVAVFADYTTVLEAEKIWDRADTDKFNIGVTYKF